MNEKTYLVQYAGLSGDYQQKTGGHEASVLAAPAPAADPT
jgi:hypothetical protein